MEEFESVGVVGCTSRCWRLEVQDISGMVPRVFLGVDVAGTDTTGSCLFFTVDGEGYDICELRRCDFEGETNKFAAHSVMNIR